jgi:hypothetical protein
MASITALDIVEEETLSYEMVFEVMKHGRCNPVLFFEKLSCNLNILYLEAN